MMKLGRAKILGPVVAVVGAVMLLLVADYTFSRGRLTMGLFSSCKDMEEAAILEMAARLSRGKDFTDLGFSQKDLESAAVIASQVPVYYPDRYWDVRFVPVGDNRHLTVRIFEDCDVHYSSGNEEAGQ